MNLLLTMNAQDFVPANVAESHSAAARRWGCKSYIQMPADSRRVFVDKCKLLAYGPAYWDRVCWIDGDLILRADAPSPFDLTTPGTVGAVRNQADAEGEAMQARFWRDLGGDDVGPIDHGTYVNGGLIVMEPRLHAKVWRKMLETTTPQHADMNPLVEQTLLNIVLRLFQVPVTLLPESMNVVGVEPWTATGPMTAYGWHMAAFGPYREGKKARLQGIDWRTVPATCPAPRRGVVLS